MKVLSVTAAETDTGVRIAIEGSGPMDAVVFQLAGPRRLIVDVANGDVTGVDESSFKGIRGVTALETTRFDLDTGQIGRLEFLLAEPFAHGSSRDGDNFVVILTRPVPPGAEEGAPADMPEETAEEPATDRERETPEREDDTEKHSRPTWTGYGITNVSFFNFEATDIPGAEAKGFGVVFVGGFRIGEIFSFEGSVNWLPAEYIPIPLVWLPSDGGCYLNIAGGVRLNLVKYSTHDTVPWVSWWSAGHAVISDFSVGGSGSTWGVGVDTKGKDGRVIQFAIRVHNFDGDLEIYDGDWSFEYGNQPVRAVELTIGFGKI